MSKNFKPKRRIEKVRNVINDNVTNTVSELILHTAEDAKTLVRMILDCILVRNDAGAVSGTYHLVVQRAEQGISVITPSVTQALDGNAPIALIYENAGVANIETVVGSQDLIHVFVDNQGMRKMKEGDTIELAHVANIASAFSLVGTITLFFKE